jgi:hypothetical protein
MTASLDGSTHPIINELSLNFCNNDLLIGSKKASISDIYQLHFHEPRSLSTRHMALTESLSKQLRSDLIDNVA